MLKDVCKKRLVDARAGDNTLAHAWEKGLTWPEVVFKRYMVEFKDALVAITSGISSQTKLRDFVRSERPRAYVRHLTSGV